MNETNGMWKERSDSILKLLAALFVAKHDFKQVKKEHVNSYFNSKYADLSDVIDATYEALSKNNLIIFQEPVLSNGIASLSTTLIHTSGEYIRNIFPVHAKGEDPQSMGSAITYLRRYALGSILGIAPESDDDGNAASKPKPLAQAYSNKEMPAMDAMPEAGTVTYNIPYKDEAARTLAKSHKFRFNKDTKFWDGRVFLPELVKYQVNQVATAVLSVREDVLPETFKNDDLPSWETEAF